VPLRLLPGRYAAALASTLGGTALNSRTVTIRPARSSRVTLTIPVKQPRPPSVWRSPRARRPGRC
jgi:hypothetical protein